MIDQVKAKKACQSLHLTACTADAVITNPAETSSPRSPNRHFKPFPEPAHSTALDVSSDNVEGCTYTRPCRHEMMYVQESPASDYSFGDDGPMLRGWPKRPRPGCAAATPKCCNWQVPNAVRAIGSPSTCARPADGSIRWALHPAPGGSEPEPAASSSCVSPLPMYFGCVGRFCWSRTPTPAKHGPHASGTRGRRSRLLLSRGCGFGRVPTRVVGAVDDRCLELRQRFAEREPEPRPACLPTSECRPLCDCRLHECLRPVVDLHGLTVRRRGACGIGRTA